MKIPKEEVSKQIFYEETLRKCLASRENRRSEYFLLREKYMNSAGQEEGGDEERERRIYAHIDQLSSFLYAQETTRFTVNWGASVSKIYNQYTPKLSQILNEQWHDSNTDILYSLAINWALVYGSTFIKSRWFKNELQTFMIEPHNMGVIREDVMGLDRQEAFVHCYNISMGELRGNLEAHPGREMILTNVIATPKRADEETGSQGRALSIITPLASVAPNIVGSVDFNLDRSMSYIPEVQEDLVDMFELYVWDNALGDYRVVTMANPDVVIYDRSVEKIFLKGTHPITQVCPNPMPTYFWGMSEVERLWPTQKQLNERIQQIRRLLRKEAYPSRSFIGEGWAAMGTDTQDVMDAYDSDDGAVRAEVGSKVDTDRPKVPEDMYVWYDKLGEVFDFISGLPPTLSGRGESGVRSKAHAAELAKLGSSRAKKRALVIEDGLEHLGTLHLRMNRAYDKTHYESDAIDPKTGLPMIFVCDQIPEDFTVKIDAHSNSPVFMDETKENAALMFKAKAIDRESLIELLAPPMGPLLIHRLNTKIIPQEAAAAQAKMAHEEKMQSKPKASAAS